MKKVLALGAESKTNFTALTEEGLYVSQAIDNLLDIKNYNLFKQALDEYLLREDFRPDYIACDLHPAYLSSGLAEELKRNNPGSVIVKVQHHHAHLALCMYDNGLDEPVIGVCFDGMGYGADEKVWGGEFLIADRGDFTRKYHLKYIPQPGADAAAREPWRMGLSYLYAAAGEDMKIIDTPLLKRIEPEKLRIILQMIEKQVNSPLTSSAGRFFDAAASVLGICDMVEFEAEAAIKLEQTAAANIDSFYTFDYTGDEIDTAAVMQQIITDLNDGTGVSVIAARFHNTLGEIIFKTAEKISRETGIGKVLVSGGCFQNKYLLNYIRQRFRNSDMQLYEHNKYPASDLGISIGQAVIVARKQGINIGREYVLERTR